MKPGIHPEYHDVVFQDMQVDFKFVTRSTAQSRDKVTLDGKEYPLIKLDTSSESHPFYTGAQTRIVETAGGEVSAEVRDQDRAGQRRGQRCQGRAGGRAPAGGRPGGGRGGGRGGGGAAGRAGGGGGGAARRGGGGGAGGGGRGGRVGGAWQNEAAQGASAKK